MSLKKALSSLLTPCKMPPKFLICLLYLISFNSWGEGKVTHLVGKAYMKKTADKTRFYPLKKGQKTQSRTLFRVDPFSLLTIELSDYSRITASANTFFYIVEEHEHFTVLLKEGTLKIKALQRLKGQNTKKIVVKTLKSRLESSLGEFIVAHMNVMDHTTVYGLSGLTLFHSKQNFLKERPVEIYENDESELTSLLERPARAKKIDEKKRKNLEDFFIPKKRPKN